MHEQKQIYSLRKLSVGLASVIVGTCFFISTNRQNVQADTVNAGEQPTSTVIQQDSSKKQDLNEQNDQTNVSNSKIEQQQSTNERNDVENVESNLNDTNKLDNDATKQIESEANQKFDQVKDQFKQETAKTKNVTTSVIEENDEGKTIQQADVSAKAEATNKAAAMLRVDSSETTLNLKGINTIDPETLNENKTEAAIKADPEHGVDPVKFASNGGFDPAIWGTMDINEWQLDNSGNIVDYNGDTSHIIIPNSADFAKAGKNYRQISISSDEMKKLAENDEDPAAIYNSDPKNLAISLTDNKKVKATNADWSNVFAKYEWGQNGLGMLRQANLEGLDTSTVTDMSGMFNGNYGLTNLDVSNWNTSNVTNMNAMFSSTRNLKDLDVSKWNTSNVTNMRGMFGDTINLKTLDVSEWNTSKVTDMSYMFSDTDSLTNLDVSKWDTSKVTDMSHMFYYASGLTSLDVSNWDTGKVTDMSSMFSGTDSLTNLDVSKWDTSKVTNMFYMFNDANSLALIVNGDKFADYLVKNNFAESNVNSDVKSVTTDNTKLLQLLTNDSQHDSATKTVVFTFPANYSPDLAKYHLTKTGNTYQIKQSVDYDKPYLQGTVLINATDNIAKHHIDTTKPNKLSDTWQPNYDKLVLAHKNSDGSVSFDAIQLPQIPGYKTVVKTVASPVNPASTLFAVSFMALPKSVTPAPNDVKPAETVSPATPVAIEVAKPIKTEPKVATTPKVIDLSDDVVATTPDVSTWHVADEPDQDTYHVSNGKYAVELPHISNAQLHVIANDSTKDSVLFTYKGQKAQYVFNIKFVNGHYLLTTYKIKSGKLVKLIDYNFIKSSKMIDVILDWLQLEQC